MSAIFDATTKYLNCTLGTTLAKAERKFITCWARFDSGESHVTGDCAMWLGESDGSSEIQLRLHNTPDLQLRIIYEANSATKRSDGTWSDDTWYLCGGWLDGDDGTTQGASLYQDATESTTTMSTSDTSGAFDTLYIGGPFGVASNQMWHGWVADAAVWPTGDGAAADTIMSQLWAGGTPLYADQIAAATPIWYDRLETGLGNEIGTLLTNNGTTLFSGAVHPSLNEAAAGGGAVAANVIFIG